MNTETNVFRIPDQNLATLHAKVKKINRRAVKLNVAPVQVMTLYPIRIIKDEGIKLFHVVEILGEAPKVKGYNFIATMDHMHSEVVIRNVPGYELPEFFNSAPAHCDHCDTIRRRKNTYVVQHEETGEYKQVGSNCLADFLGGHDPKRVAKYLEMLNALEAWGLDGGGGGEIKYHADSLEMFLPYVAACIRSLGWVSKAKAREANDPRVSPTVVHAWIQIGLRKDKERWKRDWIDLLDEDRDLAAAAIRWAEGLDQDENDYLRTIRIIAKDKYFGQREDGFAGSIIAAYKNHLRREKEKEEENKTITNEHFGDEKDKVELTVTVKYIKEIAGGYGVTLIHNMISEAGHAITWFCSGQPLEEGETVKIKATIKGHNEWKGRKQTLLTRVRRAK